MGKSHEPTSNAATTALNTFGANGITSRWDTQDGSVSYNTDLSGIIVDQMQTGQLNWLREDLNGPYGTVALGAGASHTPLRFAGQWGGYQDKETGLVLMGWRYYDPGTGRFLTKDPIGFLGGINQYSYVTNNPVNLIDPIGLWGFQFGDNGPNLGFGSPSFIFSGRDLTKAVAATADGIIPFGDPFTGVYAGNCGQVDSVYQFSRNAGAFARDTLLTAAIPNIGTWVKNPVLYEIGQKTLPLGDYKLLSHLAAIERGAAIVDFVGWREALIPSLRFAEYGPTIGTGLTPAGYLASLAAFQGVDSYWPSIQEWVRSRYRSLR